MRAHGDEGAARGGVAADPAAASDAAPAEADAAAQAHALARSVGDRCMHLYMMDHNGRCAGAPEPYPFFSNWLLFRRGVTLAASHGGRPRWSGSRECDAAARDRVRRAVGAMEHRTTSRAAGSSAAAAAAAAAPLPIAAAEQHSPPWCEGGGPDWDLDIWPAALRKVLQAVLLARPATLAFEQRLDRAHDASSRTTAAAPPSLPRLARCVGRRRPSRVRRSGAAARRVRSRSTAVARSSSASVRCKHRALWGHGGGRGGGCRYRRIALLSPDVVIDERGTPHLIEINLNGFVPAVMARHVRELFALVSVGTGATGSGGSGGGEMGRGSDAAVGPDANNGERAGTGPRQAPSRSERATALVQHAVARFCATTATTAVASHRVERDDAGGGGGETAGARRASRTADRCGGARARAVLAELVEEDLAAANSSWVRLFPPSIARRRGASPALSSSRLPRSSARGGRSGVDADDGGGVGAGPAGAAAAAAADEDAAAQFAWLAPHLDPTPLDRVTWAFERWLFAADEAETDREAHGEGWVDGRDRAAHSPRAAPEAADARMARDPLLAELTAMLREAVRAPDLGEVS